MNKPLEKYTELASWKTDSAEIDKLKKQIEVDIPRTSSLNEFMDVSGNPLYRTSAEKAKPVTKGQIELYSMLRNVLTAIANLMPTVGYVQGMNHIVGALAYHLQDSLYKSPQDAFPESIMNKELFLFWIMVYIMQNLNWRCVFIQQFAKVRKISEAFEQRLADSDKDLLDHIYYYAINDGQSTTRSDFGLLHIFMSNLLTALTDAVPVRLTGSLLDLFLLTGEKVVVDVLYRTLVFNSEPIKLLREKEVNCRSIRN